MEINLTPLLPAVQVILTALTVLLLDLFLREEEKGFLPWISVIGLSIASGMVFLLWGSQEGAFQNTLRLDHEGFAMAGELIGSIRGGHHWIPQAVVKKLNKWLTPAARNVFLKTVTNKNQTTDPHLFTKYNEIQHGEYNDRVERLLDKYVDQLDEQKKLGRSGKLSRAQAQEFLRKMIKNGAGDRRVHQFNLGVLEHLKILGLVSVIAGAVVSEFAKAADVAASSFNYRRAIEHLQRGELDRATVRLTGDADSLFTDLVDEGLAKPALLLRKWWPGAVDRALSQRVPF